MKEILTVLNICGISGFQNCAYYEDTILDVLSQRGFHEGDLHVVVSSCLSSELVKQKLRHRFGSKISLNSIEESLPLPVTFNHTIKKCVEHFGPFKHYFYLDSGISLHDPLPSRECGCSNKSLYTLWFNHVDDENRAITAAMPSNDDGRSWWGIEYTDKDYIFPIGKTTNLHCQLYSEAMRLAYRGRLIPDIFANDTSESVTSFLVAAMGKQFVLTPQVNFLHNQSMDGASIGWRGKNSDGTVKLFQTNKTMDERYHEGYEFGFGYEECKDNWLHDPKKFDENGFALDPRLLDFLNKELFLKKEEFDYDMIAHNFEPGVL